MGFSNRDSRFSIEGGKRAVLGNSSDAHGEVQPRLLLTAPRTANGLP